MAGSGCFKTQVVGFEISCVKLSLDYYQNLLFLGVQF